MLENLGRTKSKSLVGGLENSFITELDQITEVSEIKGDHQIIKIRSTHTRGLSPKDELIRSRRLG